MKGQEDFELIMETTERLKTQFAQLKAKIEELEAENAQLKGVETADAFVGRLVKTTKKMYRINRKQADSVRQVLLREMWASSVISVSTRQRWSASMPSLFRDYSLT